MKNILSCNLGSYGKYRETAYEHLPELGIRCVEIGLPKPDEVEGVLARLEKHGLSPATVMAACELKDPNAPERFEPSLDIASKMGVEVMFVSAHTGGLPRLTTYSVLRQIGERAADRGITIAIETHPDLAENGDVALEMMKGVGHPNVGINFDTGNTYYYNPGRTAAEEVKKIAQHVVSVHLKDTNGGYKAFHFPTLGLGVVDFKEVFSVLNGVGFRGPFTLELEGIEGEKLTLEETHRRVEESVAYLKRIGVV